MTDPLFTLILQSLVVLSTAQVSVHVEKIEVPHLTKQVCEAEMRAWRNSGTHRQAQCVPESLTGSIDVRIEWKTTPSGNIEIECMGPMDCRRVK